ncbi:MAG TPA: quinol:electron acceptor oxidoreductase subunit ActD, partial [Tepidisphaeraceae bacterium]
MADLTDIPGEAGDAELEEPVLAGYLAEFENVNSVVSAAEAVRDAGYYRWDVHSPFPIHGIDEAIGIRPT